MQEPGMWRHDILLGPQEVRLGLLETLSVKKLTKKHILTIVIHMYVNIAIRRSTGDEIVGFF